MIYKDFIEKIILAINNKKLTLKKVSEYAGIDISYLSKILSGKRNPPNDEIIITKIAKILELDANELLFLSGKIPQKYQKYFSKKYFLEKFYKITQEKYSKTKKNNSTNIVCSDKKEILDELL